MFKLLARDNGFVHVCGHRGHSIAAPENTLAALTATRENGGTSAEIDCVLTADGEIVLMHDDFLDRTTNGRGLVSKATLAEIKKLDAGAWFDPRFAGERVPTLMETVEHAGNIGLGLVIEVKEFQNLYPFVDRLAEIVADGNIADEAVFISFDHMFLRSMKKRIPDIRTEGITHARHADLGAVARSADLDSVSIELNMFHPDGALALHQIDVSVRLHFQQPDEYSRYREAGLDLLRDLPQWLADGLVDTISGDDVAFLSAMVTGTKTMRRKASQARSIPPRPSYVTLPSWPGLSWLVPATHALLFRDPGAAALRRWG